MGSVVSLYGNTEYPEAGTPIVSSLLDDNARLSIMDGSSIYIGLDKYNVRQGSIYGKNLYITAINPNGEGLYTLSWKQVNLSAGGTAWALCRA